MQAESKRRESVETTRPSAAAELRWMADAYEQAQRVRLQTGERIRALVQARDHTGPGTEDPEVAAEALLDADGNSKEDTGSQRTSAERVLEDIRRGRSDGPVPLLGRTYRRHWEAEQEMAKAMRQALEQHPVWPWLSRIRGIGPTLAGKLVARLDVTRAETPSAFWAYCGLATVPGVEYRCATCGYTAAFPEHYRVQGTHRQRGSRRVCSGQLERTGNTGVRVAQPRPGRGQKAPYDQYAKKVCYLVGTSFLKSGGAYAEHYRAEKAKLEKERPDWPPARRHLTALRKTEKLFLSHLWLVWREALGLSLTQPYAHTQQNHAGTIDPWQMAEGGAPATPSATTPEAAAEAEAREREVRHRPSPRGASVVKLPVPPKRPTRSRLSP